MANFEKRKTRWEKQKVKGKTKYVLSNVLLWVVYSVVLSSINILIFDRPYIDHINEIISSYIIFIVCLGLTGIVIGNISWWANVKKFNN